MSHDVELIELAELLEELKKRENHASETYKPLPKQEEFHKDGAYIRLLFGGNRSGKSRGAAQEYWWWLDESHPYQDTPKAPRIWVLSAEYRTLYEGIWLHLKNVIPPWEIAKVGPKIPNHDIPSFVEVKKGGRIDFISAQGGEDARKKVQAAEVDLIGIDEEVQGEIWTELEFRLLTKGGRVVISATLIESEDWLIDLEQRGEQGDPSIKIFRLDTKENQYNDKIALERLVAKLSDEEYKVRILGESRKFSGLVYSNFIETPGPGSHVVPTRNVDNNNLKVQIFDPGLRTAAALWVALSPSGRWEIYDEMYVHNLELPFIIEFFRRQEGWVFEDNVWQPGPKTHIIYKRIIDPAAFNRNVDGTKSIGQRCLEEYGLMFEKGNNDKHTNIEDVRRLLMPTLDGTPALVVQQHCEKFLWERRRYRLRGDKGSRDKDAARDAPVKRDDHLMNCIEYLASHGISYSPYIVSNTIEELAKLPDEEINFPSDKQERRDFKWKLKKARRRQGQQELLELRNEQYYDFDSLI